MAPQSRQILLSPLACFEHFRHIRIGVPPQIEYDPVALAG
jgi:hypothetical protein